MSKITEDEAIATARSRLGLSPLMPARALRTSRADRIGEEYYLVVIGDLQAAIGVAAVDITSGEAMIWASLPGTGPHVPIDLETAVKRAGFRPGTRARLVWRPCKASRSPLYPLWEISDNMRTVYVDQQGAVWQSLESCDHGG